MLARRLRRWSNIDKTLGRCVMFAVVDDPSYIYSKVKFITNNVAKCMQKHRVVMRGRGTPTAFS